MNKQKVSQGQKKDYNRGFVIYLLRIYILHLHTLIAKKRNAIPNIMVIGKRLVEVTAMFRYKIFGFCFALFCLKV